MLYHRAVDRFVETGDPRSEGSCWSNIGEALRLLRRWEEARQAIHRAIDRGEPFGHTAMPWTTKAILAKIEAGAGDTFAAAQARAGATTCYLAYRRDGGENHDDDGRLSLAVAEKLRAGDAAGATSLLDERSADPALNARLHPLLVALRAIVAGSRDRRLAESPDLEYSSAAEILILLDALAS